MSQAVTVCPFGEQAALAWLEKRRLVGVLRNRRRPGGPGAERGDYGQVVLEQRLRDARLARESEPLNRIAPLV